MEKKTLSPITHSWHEAWSIFVSRFWTFIAIAIIPQIVTGGSVYIVTMVVLGNLKAGRTLAEVFAPSSFVLYVVIASVTLLLILQLIAAVAMIIAATTHGKIGIFHAFNESRHSVWAFFMSSVLTTLVAMAMIFVGFIFITILTTLLVALKVPNTADWFDWLSIIPLVFSLMVVTTFIFSGIVIVVEKKKSFSSLKRSMKLFKGQYWHLILRFLLVYSVVGMFILGASLIPYVGSILASVITIPFGVIYAVVLYEELCALRA